MPIPSYILPSAPAYTEDSVYALIPTPSTPIYTPDAISFTRGSDATRTASNGLIQRSPWNLLQQSETFENAYWGKEQLTLSSNSTTAPNSTLTADTLVENTANAIHRISYNLNVVAGTSYTLSVYVKNNGRRYFMINANTAISARSTFDLQDGVVSATSSGTATITNVGDGWYRCTVTGTPSTSVLISAYFQLNNLGVATDTTYTGDGVSGFYIWGAQLVEGSQPLTYFPTTDRLNVPRIDFSQGSCPALLLEPQRTNTMLYSQAINSWATKTELTITDNYSTSPDGTINASYIQQTTGGNAVVFTSQNVSVTTGQVQTVSFYAKAKEVTSVTLRLGTSSIWSGTLRPSFTIDLSNGTFTTTGTNVASATSQNVGNGWYRYTVVTTATIASTTTNVQTATGYVLSPTSGDGFYLWGVQWEQNASYATTYIPTTSTSVTRLADSFSKSNIYTNGLITAAGGTWYVELRNNIQYTRDAGNSNLFIGDAGNNSPSNSLEIRNGGIANSRLDLGKRISGTFTTLYSTTTSTTKIAFKWNGTSVDVFVNGTKQVSASAFTITNMEYLYLQTQDVPRYIQSMALFSTPLSDAALITMTT